VSRRNRAVVFLAAAVLCAGLAASVASGYGTRLQQRYGALRAVVVAGADLRAGRPIEGKAAESLQLRRVPARFVPPTAIAGPEEAIGRVPAAIVPRGSYVLAPQLGGAGALDGPAQAGAGRSPVEIAVTGAEALAAGGGPGAARVDVVVTEESDGGGRGRTYVAARAVELLDLREGGAGNEDVAESAGWTATLALTHGEALKLIAAENFARQIRLLPESGAGS
jgi:Flp pilus assembly protein CpaB